MRKAFVCLLFSLTSSLANGATDTQFLQGLGDTRYHHVESSVIGRNYHIYVMLPDTYNNAPGIEYPTIYLLDGGGLFPLMTAYYHYLNFGDEIPDAIIVGISYGGSTFEEGNYRSSDFTAPSAERDFWGGADKFQTFLSDELLPLIEDTYRSKPSRRIIFGQSIGGQFVLFTALTKPGLFWGLIASNPALHRNLPFFMQRHGTPLEGSERPRLFVADSTLNDAQFRQPSLEWIAHWSKVDDKPWDFKATDLDGHSHMSAPPAAFREGVRWLFSN